MRELEEKLKKYLEDLPKVLESCEVVASEGSELLDLAERYLEDGRFYLKEGRKVDAFVCLCYAWALLKAGETVGVLRVPEGSV